MCIFRYGKRNEKYHKYECQPDNRGKGKASDTQLARCECRSLHAQTHAFPFKNPHIPFDGFIIRFLFFQILHTTRQFIFKLFHAVIRMGGKLMLAGFKNPPVYRQIIYTVCRFRNPSADIVRCRINQLDIRKMFRNDIVFFHRQFNVSGGFFHDFTLAADISFCFFLIVVIRINIVQTARCSGYIRDMYGTGIEFFIFFRII